MLLIIEQHIIQVSHFQWIKMTISISGVSNIMAQLWENFLNFLETSEAIY